MESSTKHGKQNVVVWNMVHGGYSPEMVCKSVSQQSFVFGKHCAIHINDEIEDAQRGEMLLVMSSKSYTTSFGQVLFVLVET